MRKFNVALCLLLFGCQYFDKTVAMQQSAFQVCADKIKSSLIAPDTYQQIWQNFNERGPISFEEYNERINKIIRDMEGDFRSLDYAGHNLLAYMKHRTLKERKADYARERGHRVAAKTGFVLIEYSAKNGFGVPLRSFAFCRLGEIGADGRFDERSVFLSGEIDRDEGDRTKKLYEKIER